jgi:hypothetical protein
MRTGLPPKKWTLREVVFGSFHAALGSYIPMPNVSSYDSRMKGGIDISGIAYFFLNYGFIYIIMDSHVLPEQCNDELFQVQF